VLAAPFASTLVRTRGIDFTRPSLACCAGVDLETAGERSRDHRQRDAPPRFSHRARIAVVRGPTEPSDGHAPARRGDRRHAGTCERIAKLELEDYGRALGISRVIEPASCW
jgi:hypothetical protein